MSKRFICKELKVSLCTLFLSLRINHHHWSIIWDPKGPRFSLKTTSLLSDTPDFYWRPKTNHQTSQAYHRRLQTFNRYPKVIIRDPRFSLNTPKFYFRSQVFHQRPKVDHQKPTDCINGGLQKKGSQMISLRWKFEGSLVKGGPKYYSNDDFFPDFLFLYY